MRNFAKQLSILLSICLLFSCAVFPAGAENVEEKMGQELIEVLNTASPDEVVSVVIFLKATHNESEIENYVYKNYDIPKDDADAFLKYYRQEVSKFYENAEKEFLNNNSGLIDEVLRAYSAGFIIARVRAVNARSLSLSDEVSSINLFVDEIPVPENEILPTEPIFTPYENFVFEMYNRYGNHFDNFVLVGYMNRYSVYYSDPVNRATCDWVWESTYGKYKFIVHGGQTGNYEPEDLGLFVFDRDNHLLYNLQEAYDNKDIDFDMLVSEIRKAQKSMNMCFTFSIEDVESNPTVPQPTKPNVTDPTSAVTDETAQPTAAPTISKTKVKKANTIEVKVKSINVKSKKLRKNKLTVKAIFVKNAQGKLSFKKLSGSKKLSVTKKGKITVKKWKKAKKGIYKIKVRVTAAGTPRFRKASKLVTVKIKIK